MAEYMYFKFNGTCKIKWINGTYTKEELSLDNLVVTGKMQAIMKVKEYMKKKYVSNNYIDLSDKVQYIWVPAEGFTELPQNIRYELDLIDIAREREAAAKRVRERLKRR